MLANTRTAGQDNAGIMSVDPYCWRQWIGAQMQVKTDLPST